MRNQGPASTRQRLPDTTAQVKGHFWWSRLSESNRRPTHHEGAAHRHTLAPAGHADCAAPSSPAQPHWLTALRVTNRVTRPEPGPRTTAPDREGSESPHWAPPVAGQGVAGRGHARRPPVHASPHRPCRTPRSGDRDACAVRIGRGKCGAEDQRPGREMITTGRSGASKPVPASRPGRPSPLPRTAGAPAA